MCVCKCMCLIKLEASMLAWRLESKPTCSGFWHLFKELHGDLAPIMSIRCCLLFVYLPGEAWWTEPTQNAKASSKLANGRAGPGDLHLLVPYSPLDSFSRCAPQLYHPKSIVHCYVPYVPAILPQCRCTVRTILHSKE